MKKEECDLYCNGKCKKFGDSCNYNCNQSSVDWLKEKFNKCEVDEICRVSSIFGNFCFCLTDKDIEYLKNGGILYKLEEYGIFIGYGN